MLIPKCCRCKISDTFDRDDNSDIGVNWDVRSGTPEIASNKLYFADPGVAIWKRNNQRGASGLQSVSVKMDVINDGPSGPRHLEYGTRVRVILGYVDDDNYIAAEYQERSVDGATDAWLAAISREAGVETVEKWAYFGVCPEEFYICLRPSVGETPATLTIWAYSWSMFAPHDSMVPFCWHREVANLGGKKGGLAVMDGEATFDDWTHGQAFNHHGFHGLSPIGHPAFPANNDNPDGEDYTPCFDPTPHSCGLQDHLLGTVNLVNFGDGGITPSTGFGVSGLVHNRGWANMSLRSSLQVLVDGEFDQTGKIVFNFKDTSNYFYVEAHNVFDPPTNTLDLYIKMVSGGVTTTLASDSFSWSFDPRKWVVCIEDDTISTYVVTNFDADLFELSVSGVSFHEGGFYFGTIHNIGPPNEWNGTVTVRGITTDASPWDDDCVACEDVV